MNVKTMQLRMEAQSDRNEIRELFRKTREAVTELLESRSKRKAAPAPQPHARPSRNGLKAVK